MSKAFPARVQDGTYYTGNQQFAGTGVTKWCCLCGTHRLQLGGTLRHVLGARQFVCARHPKPEQSK